MRKTFFCFLIFSGIIFSQDTLLIYADSVPAADTTIIFIPQSYDPTNYYPLLFMLHGWSGNYAQWSEITDLQKYADDYNFIIACPDGFYDSWYLNSTVKTNIQFEKFFFDNLVPEIFNRYKISKENIFITGLSMGGHGAITLFLKHPDFFNSGGSTSGILNITQFPKKWGIENMIGEMNDNLSVWQNNSAVHILAKIEKFNHDIIVDCGTQDFALKVNEEFYETCKTKGVRIKFIAQPGNHSRQYWKKSIDEHFRFFNELIK